MILKSVLILTCALLATAAVTEPVKLPPPPPPFHPGSSTTEGPNPNTTTSLPPTTTTSATTTTVAPTNKTTTTSTTTTATPKTTTTVTPKTTTTATPKTTTITTQKPTSPTPKPDNKLEVKEYAGNYTGTNKICLMVKMAVQIEVLNKDKNSTLINVPKNNDYTVLCPNSTSETLSITWEQNSVSFAFFKNDSRYEIESISTTLSGANSTTTFYHTKAEFSVSEKMSYYCVKDQPLNMTDGIKNDTLAKIHLSHLHYQAFMNTTEADYANVWDCDGANTSDVVPVVVGCVLAVLVVLVLVMYLFGRRRCQARGYLSM